MPTYQIRFRDGRPADVVQADEMLRERRSIVFRSAQMVVLTPRWIARCRYAASEVADVREIAGQGEAMVSSDGYRVEVGRAAALPSPHTTPLPASHLAGALGRRLSHCGRAGALRRPGNSQNR
jgi:hypothetical protein